MRCARSSPLRTPGSWCSRLSRSQVCTWAGGALARDRADSRRPHGQVRRDGGQRRRGERRPAGTHRRSASCPLASGRCPDPGWPRAGDRLRRPGVRRARARRLPRGLAALRRERRVAAADCRRWARTSRLPCSCPDRRSHLRSQQSSGAPRRARPASSAPARCARGARRPHWSPTRSDPRRRSAWPPGRCGRSLHGSSPDRWESSSLSWKRSSSPR